MTIRIRLLLGFVLVVLLLAALIGAGAIVIGYRTGKQQAIDRLQSVAALKEFPEANGMRGGQLKETTMIPLSESAARYTLRRHRLMAQIEQGLALIGSPGVSL